MALSYVTYASDGVQVQYDIPFGYLRKQHVFAFINDELRGFKWISNSRIELYVAPQPGDVLRIQRLTERASRIVDFTDGQTLLAGDLNAGDLQNFYVMQELIDQVTDGLLLGDLTILNPDGGWITAAWIAEQLDASAPPAALSELADLIAQEELARAAAVVTEANARVAGLTAEAAARVAGLLNEALARTAALAEVDAAIIAEQTARTTADAAFASNLDALLVRTGASEAAIVAEQTARTTEDEALATSLTALAVRTGDSEAAIIAEQTARTDADGALATDISGLLVRTGASEAAILAEQTARTDADGALATDLSALDVRTGTAEANIGTLFTAVTTESGARAEAVSTLNARVGGTEDSIVLNSKFQQEFEGTAIPPRWSSWSGGIGTFVSRAFGTGYAFAVTGLAGQNQGVRQDPSVSAGRKYLMAGEIRRTGGALSGAGMLLQWKNAAGDVLSSDSIAFSTDAQTDGTISSDPDGPVRWEKQVTAPPTAVSARLYAMAHYSVFGSIAAENSLVWREASLTPVSLAQAQAVENAANITTVEEAIVSEALTRASSVSSLSATVSSRPAGSNIMTNPAMSDVTSNWSTTAGSLPATGTFPNNIPNPSMPQGWLAYQTVGVTDPKQFTVYPPNGTVWLPKGVAGFMFYQNGSTAAGYAEAYSVNYPCSPGQRVGLGMRAGIHRCSATLYAFFYDSAGVYLGVGEGSTGTFTSGEDTGPASGGINEYLRLTRFTTAPANTRYMRLVIRKNYTTSGTTSYLFASCPQIMFVPDDATDLPPFDGLGDTSGSLSAAITTVSNAQVTDDAARASEISSVTAALSSRQVGANLIQNPAFTDVTSSYLFTGSVSPVGSAPLYAPNPDLPLGVRSITEFISDPVNFTFFPPNGTVWLPAGMAGIQMFQNGSSASGYMEVHFLPVPCSPGQRVGASARLSAHGCTNTLYVFFFDSAGTYISSSQAGVSTAIGPSAGVTDHHEALVFATAPANTRYVSMVIRKGATASGRSESYLFGSCFQLMFVADDATALPPFNGTGDVSGALAAGVAETKVALTDSTGAYSYYGLKINAGDNSVASIEAMSDTKTSLSKLKLKADKIEMEGAVVINGSLYKEAIAVGELTKSTYGSSATFYAFTTTWSTRFTTTLFVPASAALVRLDFSMLCQGQGGTAGTNIDVRILRNGVDISGVITMCQVSGNDIYTTGGFGDVTIKHRIGGTFASFLVDVGATLNANNVYTFQVRKSANQGILSGQDFKLFGTAFAR
jgi:hypothetical protein